MNDAGTRPDARPDSQPDPRVLAERAVHRRGVRTVTASATAGIWTVGGTYWAIIIIIALMSGYVEQHSGGMDTSVLSGVVGSAKFFLFVMGIIMPVAIVALHVAAGGTRRALTVGLWRTAAFVAVTFGLTVAVLLWLERKIFLAQGWSPTLDQAQLYEDGGQFWVVLLVQALYCGVYLLVGACVGMGYYRWGGLKGTLLVPLLLLPAAFSELTLQSGYFGRPFAEAMGLPASGVLVATAGGLAAIVAAALVLRAINRSVAIRPVDTV